MYVRCWRLPLTCCALGWGGLSAGSLSAGLGRRECGGVWLWSSSRAAVRVHRCCCVNALVGALPLWQPRIVPAPDTPTLPPRDTVGALPLARLRFFTGGWGGVLAAAPFAVATERAHKSGVNEVLSEHPEIRPRGGAEPKPRPIPLARGLSQKPHVNPAAGRIQTMQRSASSPGTSNCST